MKRRKRIMASLVAVCLLVAMIPMTGLAAEVGPETNTGGRVKAAFSVMYDQTSLDGTVITATLCERGTTTGTILGTTSNGRLELEVEASKVMGRDVLVEFSLPEGYEFQFDSPEVDKSRHTVSYRAEDVFGEEGCNIAFPVTNRAVDGKLEIETAYIVAAIGDAIDISGAFDLNSQVFPLYYTDMEGNRIRVVCDYIVSGDGVNLDENHKLNVYEAYGRDIEVTFIYKNVTATLKINVSDSGANTDADSTLDNTIEISDNEILYNYPDGTQNRIIFTDDESEYASVEGNKDYIPTGSRFENKPVTAGTIFNMAKAAIRKNFGTENIRVYEMNLWDAAGRAVHRLPGMVQVEMQLPEGLQIAEGNTLMVYRMEDNGNLTRCHTVLDGKWLRFTTDHFSTYILAEVDKSMVEPSKNVSAATINNGSGTDNGVLTGHMNASPKTGDNTMPVPLGIIAAALVGLVVMNRRKRV